MSGTLQSISNIFSDPNQETANLIKAAKSPFYNQGNAAPVESRKNLHFLGLLPPGVDNLEIQKKRVLRQLEAKDNNLDKYVLLAWLRNTNLNLFYSLLLDQLQIITPLIYTPTVGKACQEYSNIYPFLGPPGNPDGLFISINDLDRVPEIFDNYKTSLPSPFLAPEISVITDGSRILGLGDLGVNGMGIPVGKLQLYVGAAGINPSRTLPITLDFGTNNQKLIEDPLYLGLKQPRPSDDIFYASVEKVLVELRKAFPSILIQFEDFSSEHAFGLLAKHREEFFCFNDDIQGTGAVILSGFINAAKESKVAAKDHKLLFFGAGSAGVGVAKQIMEFFIKEGGLTEDEAKRRFWLVDSKGLVTLDRGDKLADHKVFFARDDNEGQQFKSVLDVVNYVKPTALVGLSSVSGVFSPEVLQRVAELNERPIVFPLSNPADNAECTFEQAMIHTNSKVIFASGTAFPKYVDPKTKEEFVPGQGNNMYIFPGLGLGAILSKPKKITDDIIYAAADSLAKSLTEEERAKNWIYPDINRIREVSAEVAAASIVQAVKENLVSDKDIIELAKDYSKLLTYVKENMWKPEYTNISPKM